MRLIQPPESYHDSSKLFPVHHSGFFPGFRSSGFCYPHTDPGIINAYDSGIHNDKRLLRFGAEQLGSLR